MKILFFFLISFSVFAKEGLVNSESLLKKYAKEVKLETVGSKIRFSFCPDNTCDLLDVNTKDRQVVWDAGLFFLFYKSTYSGLDNFKNEESVKAHLTKLQKKYKILCEKNVILGDCFNNFFAKKYNVKQLFARYDEGKLVVE